VLDEVSGADGPPMGTGGRAVVLFSGGFDSPVAAWRTMRRGVRVELCICDLGGCGQVEQSLLVARTLALSWAPGQEPKAHVVDLAPVVDDLRQRVQPRVHQLLLKRPMYRAATLLAQRTGAEAIVTGPRI
jgi:tRNA uracil 4-sulfurtransferase